jgi:hypothetical protein
VEARLAAGSRRRLRCRAGANERFGPSGDEHLGCAPWNPLGDCPRAKFSQLRRTHRARHRRATAVDRCSERCSGSGARPLCQAACRRIGCATEPKVTGSNPCWARFTKGLCRARSGRDGEGAAPPGGNGWTRVLGTEPRRRDPRPTTKRRSYRSPFQTCGSVTKRQRRRGTRSCLSQAVRSSAGVACPAAVRDEHTGRVIAVVDKNDRVGRLRKGARFCLAPKGVDGRDAVGLLLSREAVATGRPQTPTSTAHGLGPVLPALEVLRGLRLVGELEEIADLLG